MYNRSSWGSFVLNKENSVKGSVSDIFAGRFGTQSEFFLCREAIIHENLENSQIEDPIVPN